MAKNDCTRRSVYLPKTLVAWLDKQAEAEHRSVNSYIIHILEEHKKAREAQACILAH
ncbi:MAG: Arc family DNA-binding protein [Candidatus Bathyarchaeia archaeon]